jgi:hypothetical protein
MTNAGPVEVHEEAGHGVQQAIAVAAGSERDAHEETPVLEGVAEVLGDQDPLPRLGPLGDPHRPDGRQAGRLEVEEDLVLAAGDVEGLLLEGVEGLATEDEADEVPGRADGELAQHDPVGAPRGEGQLPRERQERLARLAQAKVREGAPAQGRFRR